MSKLVGFILKMMGAGGEKVRAGLEAASLDPRGAQEKLLKTILARAKGTEIDARYNLDTIDSIRTFQERFPLTTFDDYVDSVARMMTGEKNILTNQKVVHFNVTSGTLGVPKKIPVTELHVKHFADYNAKYVTGLAIRAFGTEWTTGKGFSLSEGSCETLPTGATVGCASSLQSKRMSQVSDVIKFDPMSMMYTSPIEARIPKVVGYYGRYLHARFAMQEENITYAMATFSSYLMEIFRFIENHYDMLVDDIEKGTINPAFNVPEEVCESISKRLRPMPKRAKALREAGKGGAIKLISRIWPKLTYILCVGGAGFQTYTDKIFSRYVEEKVGIIYLGVSSSEGLYSTPLEANDPESILIPDKVLMEFIPLKNGERDLSGGIKLIDELEVGCQYELLISNVSGLFRYQLKDVIEVSGFHNKTPMVHFMNRAGFAINMYAEKTSEAALRTTVEETAKQFDLDLTDYCVVPYEGDSSGQYIFLLECNKLDKESVDMAKLRDFIETTLTKNNPVYYESVEEGRLVPLSVRFLQPETFTLYRELMIYKGASAAQLKPVHVANSPFQKSFFMRLIEEEND